MSEKRCTTCKHVRGPMCDLIARRGGDACDGLYSGWEPADADGFLRSAAEVLAERGKNYDDGRERSMRKIVIAFNGVTGHALTERDGWLFMQVLKLVRLTTADGFHRDSYEDNVAYAALMAEAATNYKTD